MTSRVSDLERVEDVSQTTQGVVGGGWDSTATLVGSLDESRGRNDSRAGCPRNDSRTSGGVTKSLHGEVS